MDTPYEPAAELTARAGVSRGLLLVAGIVSVGLGLLGAILPVLPTTPFLILGAACLARSSPRLHARLLRNRVVGPYLLQWNRDHSVPRRAKRKAYVVVVASFTVSIIWISEVWIRWVLVAIGATLLLCLSRLRTTHETAAHLAASAAKDSPDPDARRPAS